MKASTRDLKRQVAKILKPKRPVEKPTPLHRATTVRLAGVVEPRRTP
jgi:hypothetical protein